MSRSGTRSGSPRNRGRYANGIVPAFSVMCLASSAEISFLLGYEDPNSFFRAFHAWTGQTPERARAATVG